MVSKLLAGVVPSNAAGLVLVAAAAQCEDPAVDVSRSVVIARSRQDVFEFIADARNDPSWCAKVLSVAQIEGDGPGPGARYRVTHRPIPVRPPRDMLHACLSWTPPGRIQWREDDGTDVLIVTYALEDLGAATRLTQHDEVDLGAPRVLQPLMRAGIGHDVARQLKTLKKQLETRSAQKISVAASSEHSLS